MLNNWKLNKINYQILIINLEKNLRLFKMIKTRYPKNLYIE